MDFKTRIVVLRMKEIVYITTFIGLAILPISLFLVIFRPKKDAVPSSADTSAYIPGVYMTLLVLGSQDVSVKMVVNANHINPVALSPLSDSVAIMYPLIQSVFEDLAKQVCAIQSTGNLSYSMETRYTSVALISTTKQMPHRVEIRGTQQRIYLSIPAS